MSTGFATPAAAGRNDRSSATVSAESSGTARPRASQVSAHWIPRPPALVTIATLRALRDRLIREQRRDVEHLLERVGPDHAHLPQQRIHRAVGRREQGARVRRGGALPRGAPAALHRHHGLAAADPPDDAREALWIPERLQVQEHDVRARVLLPVAEEVVRGDVRLVPDRDERGEAEREGRRHVDDGEPERARLRHECNPPFRWIGLRERAVQADLGIRVDHAHAVRADQAHAGRTARLEQLRLAVAVRPRRSRRNRRR